MIPIAEMQYVLSFVSYNINEKNSKNDFLMSLIMSRTTITQTNRKPPLKNGSSPSDESKLKTETRSIQVTQYGSHSANSLGTYIGGEGELHSFGENCGGWNRS